MQRNGTKQRNAATTRLALAALLAAAAPLAYAQGGGGEAPAPDVQAAPACRHCNMDRARFASSRMLIEYDDGTSVGTCSLHCAAVDLVLTMDKTPKALKVADLGTKQLVDAEKAFWVVGGKKPGVMTVRGKWAFADKKAAEAFAKENGGTLVSFEAAMKAAYEDMYQDGKAIRAKRAAHHRHQGER